MNNVKLLIEDCPAHPPDCFKKQIENKDPPPPLPDNTTSTIGSRLSSLLKKKPIKCHFFPSREASISIILLIYEPRYQR